MWGKWTCARTDAHLDEALMGELGFVRQRRFGRHRRECARCRAAIGEAVETVGLLRSWPMDTPRTDLAAVVLAARLAAPEPQSVSWVRYAQATVSWAVCLMVVLLGGMSVFWPGFLQAPQDYAVGAFTAVVQTLDAVVVVAMTAVRAVGALVWSGFILGLIVFYSAAFAGLRHFLVRRPV